MGTVTVDLIRPYLEQAGLDGARVCLIVPDATRTGPVRPLLDAVYATLRGRAADLTVLVALGTHAPMSEAALANHLGPTAARDARNHAWWDADTFVDLGEIPEARVAELSGGRLRRAVPVRVNRAVVESDVAIVLG